MITQTNKKKRYLLQSGITNYTTSERHLFKTDHIGLFSLTSAKIAEELCYNIIALFPENYNIEITDSTASVGGNSISFILNEHFSKVNSVELDPMRYEMLQFNINIKKGNIIGEYILYNKSYMHIKNNLTEDIIFMDPPWGGPEYYKQDKVKLYLDNIHLGEIINQLFKDKKKLTYVLIKTPKNFDINDFISNILNNLLIEKIGFSCNLKKINFFLIKRV